MFTVAVGVIVVAAAAVGALHAGLIHFHVFSKKHRVDDEDMPPHPTKLGERLPGINQRPLTADR